MILEFQTLDIAPISLLPASIDHMDNVPFVDLYKEERTINGQTKLGRPLGTKNGEGRKSVHFSQAEIEANPTLALTPIQYRTLRLHMAGFGAGEMASILGITEVAVRCRLALPQVKAAKAKYLETVHEDIQAMVPDSLDIYREGLRHRNFDTKLKVADRIMKMNRLDGSYPDGNENKKDMSASEMVANMYKMLKQGRAKVDMDFGRE